MQGEGNGKYFPERLVTRAEFATLITRAFANYQVEMLISQT